MTTYEIIISLIVTFISLVTFLDKIENRKREKRENMCKEHQHTINNLQQVVQGLQLEKAENDDLNELKSEISALKADINFVKSGIQRIESLIMERKL